MWRDPANRVAWKNCVGRVVLNSLCDSRLKIPLEVLQSKTNSKNPSLLWKRGSGAGTIFQQGGQDQPFPAGGLGAL